MRLNDFDCVALRPPPPAQLKSIRNTSPPPPKPAVSPPTCFTTTIVTKQISKSPVVVRARHPAFLAPSLPSSRGQCRGRGAIPGRVPASASSWPPGFTRHIFRHTSFTLAINVTLAESAPRRRSNSVHLGTASVSARYSLNLVG